MCPHVLMRCFNHCRLGSLVKQIQHVAVTRLRQNQQCRRPHHCVLRTQQPAFHGNCFCLFSPAGISVAEKALVNAHNAPGLAACLHTAAFYPVVLCLPGCLCASYCSPSDACSLLCWAVESLPRSLHQEQHF